MKLLNIEVLIYAQKTRCACASGLFFSLITSELIIQLGKDSGYRSDRPYTDPYDYAPDNDKVGVTKEFFLLSIELVLHTMLAVIIFCSTYFQYCNHLYVIKLRLDNEHQLFVPCFLFVHPLLLQSRRHQCAHSCNSHWNYLQFP